MLFENKLKILASFFPECEENTSKQIETSTGLSHEPAFRILKQLVTKKYLKQRKIGKTNVYQIIIQENTLLIYTYFMTKKINQFKQKHQLIHKRLQEYTNTTEANSVILFGSYAKGNQTEKSDIDILIISDKKESEKIAFEFKTKYNINIKPIIVNPQDFKNIKKDNPAFYQDLIKFGIVFSGTEWFFKQVYKNATLT